MPVEVALSYRAERDKTVYEGEEGMVLAEADVLARQHLGTALAHDDIARLGELAGKQFNAQILSVGIGKVFC